jgi:3-oxoacyl-[acyl-carrier protein] reductase
MELTKKQQQINDDYVKARGYWKEWTEGLLRLNPDFMQTYARYGGYAHYGAAKAAIAHYTRFLAQDLGPSGITANCIAPGMIATARIIQNVLPGSIDANRDFAELISLRRLGTVEDCAKVMEFLATDLSDYVTGAVIPVDGGLMR